MYVYFNSNPYGLNELDCVIRAISLVTAKSWDQTYMNLSMQGYYMKGPLVANRVWGAYLQSIGFSRDVIPNRCPPCYTVSDFCHDNPLGVYLLAAEGHVIPVIDGNYYDSWDSGDEIPLYFWRKDD